MLEKLLELAAATGRTSEKIDPVWGGMSRVAVAWHDPARVAQALRDTLGGSRCRHEYDCCGCASRYVKVIRKTRRDLLVRTFVTYNY